MRRQQAVPSCWGPTAASKPALRSEEHTSELQSQSNLVCRLLLEKKKRRTTTSLLPISTATHYRRTILTSPHSPSATLSPSCPPARSRCGSSPPFPDLPLRQLSPP